jgi:hypothetical protein
MNKQDRKKLLDHIGRIQAKIVDTAEVIIDVVATGLKAPAQGRRAPATVARRQIANMLRVSQFCANPVCRRSHCCRGEPSHCLQAVIPLLPADAFDGLLTKRRRPSLRSSARPGTHQPHPQPAAPAGTLRTGAR